MVSGQLSSYHNARGPAARLVRACDQTRLVLLCAALIGLPFALGGRADWALPAMGLVNAAGVALLFLEIGFSDKKLRWHRSWLYGAVILALISIQILPLENLTSLLSPQAWQLWEEAREAGFTERASTLSLAPVRTRLGLIMLTQIGLTGLLIYNTFTTRRRLMLLAGTVAAAALANAIAGFIPIILDAPPLFADLDIRHRPLSGTFLNRNHFGFLMMLGLLQLAGIAWALYGTRFYTTAEESQGQRRLLETQFERRSGPLLALCGLAAAPVIMGLFLSLSRGASLSATLGLILFAWVSTKSGTPGPKREIILPLVLVGGALVIGGVEALTALRGRYETLMELGSIGLIGRWNYWTETLHLIRQFPLTGVGLHAFEPASPMVESGIAAGKITFHAHNDYLEILSEVGLPLGLLILGLVITAIVRLWKQAVACEDRFCRALATGAVCALVAGAVHEFVEYSLRAPANGFLAVALATLALALPQVARTSNNSGNDKKNKEGERKGHRSNRQRVRRPTGSQVKLIGRRAGFTVIAVAVTGGAVWFYPPRIGAGKDLMELRKIAYISDDFETTGAARRMQSEYCVKKAESILSVMPDKEMANYYRALYLQMIASDISRRYAGEEVAEEEFLEVTDAVLASREAARRLTAHLPTQGYYQALFAKQLNFSAWYDYDVEITDIIQAYETAHARFPNVPQVTRLCLQGFAEILEVDREELSAEQLERLEKKFKEMGRALLEENPSRAERTYAILKEVVSEPGELIEMTPPRLWCYENLYEMLFRRGDYQKTRRVVELMKEINRDRLTRAQESEISLYDLVRTHPASREEMAARITRKESAVASVTGSWQEYADLRAEDYGRQRELCLQQLRRARAAAAESELHQAIRIGRRLRREYPDIAEVRADLTEWLITVGNYEEALENIQVLMWLEDASPECLLRGLKGAERLTTVQRFRRSAKTSRDILLLRLAAEGVNINEQKLNSLIIRLGNATGEERMDDDETEWSSVYVHLIYYYAGRYSEINGDYERSVKLYQQVLNRCPFHYRTARRIMDMPADIAGELQSQLDNVLAEKRLKLEELQNDLIDLAAGIKLRSLIIEPREIQLHDAVTITATVELTGDVTEIPPLQLHILGADGTEFRRTLEATQRNWDIPPEDMKVGRIVKVQTHLAPGTAALDRGEVMPDGPIHIAIPGGGRDSGFKFYHPGVIMRRGR